MDPQTLLDSTFFLIPSFVPKKGLDPEVSTPDSGRYSIFNSHIGMWEGDLFLL